MYEIVLIDDDDAIRENLAEIITIHSFKLIPFSDGNLALKNILSNPPDLIICDIMMPSIHGYHILEELRNNHRTACIPFIFITAKSEISDMRFGMEKGADDYLIKPFTSVQLISAIHSRLEASRRARHHKENELYVILDNLSKIISHEYNTPLNGIIGLSELLIDTANKNNDEASIDYLTKINESGIILKNINIKLINLVNTLSNSKALPPNVITVDEFQKFTSQIINKIAIEQNRNKDILITSEIKNSSAYIVFPYEYLEIIIKEISYNAIKFSETGSIVSINFSFHKNHEIKLLIKNASKTQLDFIKDRIAFSLDKTINGKPGLTTGLLIVDKLCKVQNCKFSMKKYEDTVEASLSIRYLL